MKTTKAIYLTFSDFSTNASAYIFIPFMVKHIHTRAISYQRGGTTSSPAEYGVLTSDLTGGDPLGVYYNDSTYSTAVGSLTHYEARQPITINGQYTFTMTDASGSTNLPVNNPDYIILLLEFESDDVANL